MIEESDPKDYLINPDAWIKIPEFGVLPEDVNYEGFSYPVFYPTISPLAINLMGLIHEARQLAQKEFTTLSELRVVFEGAMTQLIEDEDEDSWGSEWTPKECLSVIYMQFMAHIQEVVSPLQTFHRETRHIEELSSAALILSYWGGHGAKSAYQLLSKRNSSNASMPRPNARSTDHNEVKIEFNRLVREGHTEREARGILVDRGNMGSQSTIYRATVNNK